MKKNKYPTAKTAEELAEILGLSPAEGLDIKIRSELNDKIIETVEKKKLTHAQVAKLAGTSRTRVTAIMNRNTMDISTDLLLRVLAAIGIEAKLTFKRVA